MTGATFANQPIPAELGNRLRRLYGLPVAPATLGELVRLCHVAPRPESLYTTSGSRHAVRIGETERHTHCVLDALMLPFLTGSRVEAESVSPDGDRVQIRMSRGGIEVHPAAAVMSFGVGDGESDSVLEALCPFVNAFPSQEAYERWAAATPGAVTMALPLVEAIAFAEALAGCGPESCCEADESFACKEGRV